MTTFLMCLFVVTVAAGAAILGWLARAQNHGLTNDTDLIDRGEVGVTQTKE